MNVEHNPVTVEKLQEIVAYLPYFTEEKSSGELKGGAFQMPYVVYDEKVNAFQRLLYDSDFIVVFDWISWDEGRKLTEQRDKLMKTDLLTLRMLLTTILRNDRFNEGVFLYAIQDGLVSDILQRIKILLESGGTEIMIDTKTIDNTPKYKSVDIYVIERTTKEGPYEIACQGIDDAESLFEQVKDHVTTIYTRLLVNGQEVKAHRSTRNMLAMSDMFSD